MSGSGLRIRAPNRNTRTQRQNELQQIALGSELVAHEDVAEALRSDSGSSENARLQDAFRHRRILEAAAADPSEFIGLHAEEVSPPNPFIRFGNSEIHMVSPLSYQSTTPIELNSPVPSVRFGSKSKRKLRSIKKSFTRRSRFKNLNLVKLLKKTLRKRKVVT
jgi:hypothetical protein